MKLFDKKWFKPSITIGTLIVLIWLLPSHPVDPWNLLNLKKITSMIFALAIIQIVGSIISQSIGAKSGAILTGFVGGLISSTATTAALARQSKVSPSKTSSVEVITFLSATAAMLFEGISVLLVGINEIHPSLLLIFIGPILATICMIYFQSQKLNSSLTEYKPSEFEIIPTLKLALFILTILVLSQLLQKFFGQNGVYILTFLVSLFEIHGSVIANIQMHDAELFSVLTLGNLLTISIIASYCSKLILIFTLSHRSLSIRAFKSTALLILSLILSWGLFFMLNR